MLFSVVHSLLYLCSVTIGQRLLAWSIGSKFHRTTEIASPWTSSTSFLCKYCLVQSCLILATASFFDCFLKVHISRTLAACTYCCISPLYDRIYTRCMHACSFYWCSSIFFHVHRQLPKIPHMHVKTVCSSAIPHTQENPTDDGNNLFQFECWYSSRTILIPACFNERRCGNIVGNDLDETTAGELVDGLWTLSSF